MNFIKSQILSDSTIRQGQEPMAHNYIGKLAEKYELELLGRLGITQQHPSNNSTAIYRYRVKFTMSQIPAPKKQSPPDSEQQKKKLLPDRCHNIRCFRCFTEAPVVRLRTPPKSLGHHDQITTKITTKITATMTDTRITTRITNIKSRLITNAGITGPSLVHHHP